MNKAAIAQSNFNALSVLIEQRLDTTCLVSRSSKYKGEYSMATTNKPATSQVEILPSYQPGGKFVENNSDMCIVLHGYGRVAATEQHYIDDYKFIGGVGRNIPRSIANAWKKGVTRDGKPAVSRVFPQAILPSDATEVDFATASGINPMDPAKLAAMITATDAEVLVQALGLSKAMELAEQLVKNAKAI
jgi:hypothetical protein